MTAQTKVGIIGAVVFILTGILGVHFWMEERIARAKAEATVAAQQANFEKAQDSIKELQDADKERDAKAAETIAALTQAAAKQVTPEQIAAYVSKSIPTPAGAPPITITVPPATATNPKPDAIADIPQADLPALKDYVSKCQLDSAKLSICDADVTSRDQQLKLAGEQLSAVSRERDAYKKALNGGTFWQRVKKAGKWLVIGGVAGGIALGATGHIH